MSSVGNVPPYTLVRDRVVAAGRIPRSDTDIMARKFGLTLVLDSIAGKTSRVPGNSVLAALVITILKIVWGSRPETLGKFCRGCPLRLDLIRRATDDFLFGGVSDRPSMPITSTKTLQGQNFFRPFRTGLLLLLTCSGSSTNR